MAQQLIVDFLAELAATLELPEPIVEFGSLQVEADQPGDLRPLFRGRDFTGTDIRPGPGVDRIEDLRALSYGDGEVGTALCLDTLEHCDDPLAAGRELHRVLRADGVCVVSSVMLFPIHAYPSDYWRFTPEGMRVVLSAFDSIWVAGVGPAQLPMQVIAVATRRRPLELELGMFKTLEAEQRRWDQAHGKVRFGIVQVSLRELMAVLVRQLPRAVMQRASARMRGLP